MGHSLQNAYAAVSSFFARLNFFSKPDEGGVSVPSVSIENLLPGHVNVGAMSPSPPHDQDDLVSGSPAACQPVYDRETGAVVPGKCDGTDSAEIPAH